MPTVRQYLLGLAGLATVISFPLLVPGALGSEVPISEQVSLLVQFFDTLTKDRAPTVEDYRVLSARMMKQQLNCFS